MNKLMKPSEYARREIIRKIIQSDWDAGSSLPSERNLSTSLGITRATLREVLKLLEKEGWIKISHGRPSKVNNFWDEGGLGILSGLTENKDLFPLPLIRELLEVRADILPKCASRAFKKNFAALKKLVSGEFPSKNSSSSDFTSFDWNIQQKIILLSENRVYRLILNEFQPLLQFFSREYFKLSKGKETSVNYYFDLKNAVINRKDPEQAVKHAMKQAIVIWDGLLSN